MVNAAAVVVAAAAAVVAVAADHGMRPLRPAASRKAMAQSATAASKAMRSMAPVSRRRHVLWRRRSVPNRRQPMNRPHPLRSRLTTIALPASQATSRHRCVTRSLFRHPRRHRPVKHRDRMYRGRPLRLRHQVRVPRHRATTRPDLTLRLRRLLAQAPQTGHAQRASIRSSTFSKPLLPP